MKPNHRYHLPNITNIPAIVMCNPRLMGFLVYLNNESLTTPESFLRNLIAAITEINLPATLSKIPIVDMKIGVQTYPRTR